MRLPPRRNTLPLPMPGHAQGHKRSGGDGGRHGSETGVPQTTRVQHKRTPHSVLLPFSPAKALKIQGGDGARR